MKSSESRYNKCLYFTSNALARKVEKLATESWKTVGMSPSHGYLLMVAMEEPGVQPTALADELQLTPSTITRLLEKLESNKLIVRITEGKTTAIYATTKAKELKPRMLECVKDFHQKSAIELGEQECGRIVGNMHKLNEKLKA